MNRITRGIKKLVGNSPDDLENRTYQSAIQLSRGNNHLEYPSDFSEIEKELISQVKNYTMTSQERLVSLFRTVEYIEANKLEGDIVECGVWRGGGMMLVAKVLKHNGNEARKLFLFDTFEGMAIPTTDYDISVNNDKALEIYSEKNRNLISSDEWCHATFAEVQKNIFGTGYNPDNIHMIKGKVEETIPCRLIDKIAVLRLDTDWYESTKHELESLYDRLVIGGILIIDDYGHWTGARKAVDEFFAERNIPVFLNRVDYTCRIVIKSR